MKKKKNKEIYNKTKGKYGTTILVKSKKIFHPRQLWFNRMMPFKEK